MLIPRHSALLPKPSTCPQAGSNYQTGRHAFSTDSQGASTALPQVNMQAARGNNPWGSSRLPSQNRGNTLEDPNLKWLINLSRKPLTQAQRSVLAKGPNFVVSPRHPPNVEYITAIESVCTKLGQQDAEELRADISRVLRSSHPLNLT